MNLTLPKKTIITVSKFLMAGTLAAATQYIVLFITHTLLDLSPLVYISVSYAASLVTHFTCNRLITFAATHTSLRYQLPRYLLVAGCNYVITLCVATFMIERLLFSPYIATACSIVSTTAFGFFLSRHWIFKAPPSIPAEPIKP